MGSLSPFRPALCLPIALCLLGADILLAEGGAWEAPDVAAGLEGRAPEKIRLVEGGMNYQRELVIRASSSFPWLPPSVHPGVALVANIFRADTLYDLLPELGIHCNFLNLDDGTAVSGSNAEYFTVGMRGYWAYDDLGEPVGNGRWPMPMGVLGVGKYWKPYEDAPWGLDFYLELDGVLYGRLRSARTRSGGENTDQLSDLIPLESVRLTVGLNVFYRLP